MENIIRNIDDTYSVSSEGKIFKNGKEKKGCVDNRNGYIRVYMHSKRYYLHRIVAQAFIPNPENKLCIDRLNTVKTDNRVENLRWVSHKENSNNPLTKKHQSEWARTDETKRKMSEAKKGSNHPFYGKHRSEETKRKMSEAHSKPVVQYTKEGEFIREWSSVSEIERELGYNQGNISMCCLNKRSSSYGYLWKFKKIN